MALEKVELDVSSNVLSVAQAVLAFSVVAKAAVADGWDASKDLPALLQESVKQLVPALAKIEPALAEFSSDEGKVASVLALIVAVAKSGLLK